MRDTSAGPKSVLRNPDNETDYVKDDSEHYWVGNNCNHLISHCLREMGCDVSGLALMLSKFHVLPQPIVAGETVIVAHPAQKSPRPATMPSAKVN